MESYSIEVPKPWTMPWSGKQLEEREKLLSDGIEKYFEEHTEVKCEISMCVSSLLSIA